MGRLIDADICLNEAWQNFYKQEDEHEKLYENYDILRDRHFEQCGFECCQQTIVNAPTVEAIPKADYENRLKADLKAILVELQLECDENTVRWYCGRIDGKSDDVILIDTLNEIIQQKIDAMEDN
jgi:hypothetical protein